jgi:hypothetical protein
MEHYIALPQMGTVTFTLFDKMKGKQVRNVKVVYINAGQSVWTWEIRDAELPQDKQPAGFVEASSLVEAVERIAVAVVSEYSGSITPEKEGE